MYCCHLGIVPEIIACISSRHKRSVNGIRHFTIACQIEKHRIRFSRIVVDHGECVMSEKARRYHRVLSAAIQSGRIPEFTPVFREENEALVMTACVATDVFISHKKDERRILYRLLIKERISAKGSGHPGSNPSCIDVDTFALAHRKRVPFHVVVEVECVRTVIGADMPLPVTGYDELRALRAVVMHLLVRRSKRFLAGLLRRGQTPEFPPASRKHYSAKNQQPCAIAKPHILGSI